MNSQHLEADQIAAYLDRDAEGAQRSRIEAHLVECVDCRRELLEADEIRASLPARRALRLVPVAAAAAAVLAVGLVSRADRKVGAPVHREPAVTATMAPATIAPRGELASVDTIRWSRVPSADRYRVAIYESEGTPVWEATVNDTAAALPDTVHLRPGRSYYWSVRARTGWDRWTESVLTRFQVTTPTP
jgi:anti-sigma factor RsiW